MRPRDVQERRQQRQFLHLPGGDHLWDVERVQLRSTDRLRGRIDIRHSNIGGTEINTDQVAGHQETLYLVGIMIPTILGLDIGGANLKAATADQRVLSVPFALWRQPDKLPATLAELVAQFPEADELAVTMTGELCDCYETKREGVAAILAAVRFASAGRRIRVWSTDGQFLDPEQAQQNHLLVASANWHALATFVGRYVPNGPATLIDIGSTTTDLIPMLDGRPVARGRTDPERLRHYELVYTGVRRTPVMALMESRVAAEVFATTLDVYLWLGMIPETFEDSETADGRPATQAQAFNRLCRMVCGDRDCITVEDIDRLANEAMQRQVRTIAMAYHRVGEAIGIQLAKEGRHQSREPLRIPIISGSGEFLLRHAFQQNWIDYGADRGVEPIWLTELLNHDVSTCAPAYAVAVLASERPADERSLSAGEWGERGCKPSGY